ncbi:CPBP family intramembrane glutamic endopeptidase [Paenibacillus thermotolerans]|uniref:CPBP family intramembrane glutamic endopeptidase n=1 Tax=Paenibacillus thermotolerans TaxID=3027807 RepID=UPI0023686646|nr:MULTISPECIES: type II CAAX endopeptidase family protein [unclassified Paenibacillus]
MRGRYVPVLFSYFVVTALSVALMKFILPWAGIDVSGANPIGTVLAGTAMSAVIIAVEWALFKKLIGEPLQLVGFGLDRQGVVFSALSLVFIFGFPIGFLEMMGTDYTWNADMYSSIGLSVGYIALAVVCFVAAAFQEEFFNRGFVFASWGSMSRTKLIVLSSLLFMLMHVPVKGANPVSLADWFIAGILFMYVYIQSGSVWAATLVHAGMNLMLALIVGEMDYSLLKLNNPPSDLSGLLFLVLIYSGMFILTFAVYGGKGKLQQPAKLEL